MPAEQLSDSLQQLSVAGKKAVETIQVIVDENLSFAVRRSALISIGAFFRDFVEFDDFVDGQSKASTTHSLDLIDLCSKPLFRSGLEAFFRALSADKVISVRGIDYDLEISDVATLVVLSDYLQYTDDMYQMLSDHIRRYVFDQGSIEAFLVASHKRMQNWTVTEDQIVRLSKLHVHWAISVPNRVPDEHIEGYCHACEKHIPPGRKGFCTECNTVQICYNCFKRAGVAYFFDSLGECPNCRRDLAERHEEWIFDPPRDTINVHIFKYLFPAIWLKVKSDRKEFVDLNTLKRQLGIQKPLDLPEVLKTTRCKVIKDSFLFVRLLMV